VCQKATPENILEQYTVKISLEIVIEVASVLKDHFFPFDKEAFAR
jgi:hypothetical protein